MRADWTPESEARVRELYLGHSFDAPVTSDWNKVRDATHVTVWSL